MKHFEYQIFELSFKLIFGFDFALLSDLGNPHLIDVISRYTGRFPL